MDEEVQKRVSHWSREILNAYKHYGFVSIVIGGFQGEGKTTLGMLIMQGVYNDWNKVLDEMYFDPERCKEELRQVLRERSRLLKQGPDTFMQEGWKWRKPVVMIEDAGVGFIKYEALKFGSIEFNKLYSLARSACSGFIFTAVEKEDISKYVRGKFRYGILVESPRHQIQSPYRRATGYEYRLAMWNPTSKPKGRRVYGSTFKLDLPPEVRWKYEIKRDEFTLKVTGPSIPVPTLTKREINDEVTETLAAL